MGTMGSFAQSLGGSQPATPLDLSYVQTPVRHLTSFAVNTTILSIPSYRKRLTISMILASFPLFRAHRNSRNPKTPASRYGRMRANEQLNTHQCRDSNTRQHHSPPPVLPKHRHTLRSNRPNLLMMICFLPGHNSLTGSTISEMVGKGSAASSEPAANPRQATLTSSLLWVEMPLLKWLRIAEAL